VSRLGSCLAHFFLNYYLIIELFCGLGSMAGHDPPIVRRPMTAPWTRGIRILAAASVAELKACLCISLEDRRVSVGDLMLKKGLIAH